MQVNIAPNEKGLHAMLFFENLENIRYVTLNILGVFCPISWRTEEDLDMQMGVNHFGHVLLTELLLPLIKRAADISGVTMGEKGKIISSMY